MDMKDKKKICSSKKDEKNSLGTKAPPGGISGMFLYDRNSLPLKGGEAELCSARSEETELKTVSERKHPREEILTRPKGVALLRQDFSPR